MKQPKLHLNLASEPFRRDRPVFVASVVVSVLLALALVTQVSMILTQRAQAAEARTTIAALEKQAATFDREMASVSTTLRRPENAEVLERSLFLNILLARKGISWTRIFSDLETVVPHNVRLISVRPQANSQNNVMLDLYVGTQAPEPVIDMMMKMETSPLFGKVTIVNTLPPSQSEPFYRSRVTVNYAQKL